MPLNSSQLPDDRLLSDALSVLEIKLARLEQRSHEREASLKARDEEILGLKEIIKTLQAQHLSALEEIQRRGATLRAVRSGFENSTSWKVTKPLRWFMQRLRGQTEMAPVEDVEDSEVTPAHLLSVTDPAPFPENELQWLQKLDCNRSDYTVWLQTFDPRIQRFEVETALGETGLSPLKVKEQRDNEPSVCFVSALVPGAVTVSSLAAFDAMWEVLSAQTISDWEWLIVADVSQSRVLSQWAADKPGVRILEQPVDSDQARVDFQATLETAGGHYTAWLDPSFVVRPHAVNRVLTALQQRPDVHVLYADEDALGSVSPNDHGSRHEPHFFCDYNADLWLSGDPLGRLVVFQTAALRQAGVFRSPDPVSNRHELLLRMVEHMEDPSRQILHLPEVLSHRVDDVAVDGETLFRSPWQCAQPSSLAATDRAVSTVQQHLDRTGTAATALPHPSLPGRCRVRYALPSPAPTVGIVIPTRDSVGVLSVCLSTLLERSSYPNFHVVVVDNGSCKPETLSYLQAITDPRVTVIRDDAPFNFSRVVNLGAAAVQGDILCLLNNDMQITQPDWLEEMVGWAIQPGVAAVGARLWYGEGQLQHGGIILGIQGMAGHAHKFLKKGDPGYMNRAELHQTMSAVTGACMVVRRSVYEELGGFDEALGVAYNDVDFCLRARKAGYRNVWTPHAEMIHHESISRGFEDSPEKQARFQREAALMRERWADWLADDPAYNPNLTLEHEDFGLAWPPRKRLS